MTGKQRSKEYRERQKKLGRIKRDYFLTDGENKKLRKNLVELRKSNE
jgi:hypothetical protein